MGVKGFSTALTRSFYFAWLTTLVSAGGTYYILARLFPQASYVENKDLKFKEWDQETVESWATARRIGDTAGAADLSTLDRNNLAEEDGQDDKGVEGADGSGKKDEHTVSAVAVLPGSKWA